MQAQSLSACPNSRDFALFPYNLFPTFDFDLDTLRTMYALKVGDSLDI